MKSDPKMLSITGRLVPNKLTQREDDYTFSATYVGNRSIKDLCQLAVKNGSKFTVGELESAYNDLMEIAKDQIYKGALVEFGFTNNSIGVDGVFIGPGAQFNPETNTVVLRSAPRMEFKDELKQIGVIVTGTQEGMPTVTRITDIATETENLQITPGGVINGEGIRIKVVGDPEETGYFFISEDGSKTVKVDPKTVSRNGTSLFSFIVPSELTEGKWYLEIATQYSGTKLLKEARRNRFPYPLTVGEITGGGEAPDPIDPGEAPDPLA